MNKKVQEIIKRNQYRSKFYQQYKKPPVRSMKKRQPSIEQSKRDSQIEEETKKNKLPFIYQMLGAVMVLLLGMIVKKDPKMAQVQQILFTNMNMMKIDQAITDHLGSIFPIPDSDDLYVNLPLVNMTTTKSYHEGVLVSMPLYSEVTSHINGIVVEMRKDDELGTIIVIQEETGQYYEYALLEDVQVKIYNRIQAGDRLGMAKTRSDLEGGEFYLAIRDRNQYLNVLEVISNDRSH